MAKSWQIKEVALREALHVRQKVMWPDKDLDFVKVPKDENALHLGLYVNQKVISVVSLFIQGQEAQFRKFATLVEYQGMGYGSHLLSFAFHHLGTQGVQRIWCNARMAKKEFYQKFGLTETEKTFIKEGIPYLIMEKRFS